MRVDDCEVRLSSERSVSVRLATRDGVDDPIARVVASGGWQPTDALRWLLLEIRPGDNVLDLGGHIGTFAIPAAALGATVTVVEASPGNAELLRAAAEATGVADTVTVVEAAVTDHEGEVSFVDHGPYGTLETAGTGRTTGWSPITVPATTIDALAGGPFQLVKIDVEGAECAALRGGARSLPQARALAVESNGYMLGQHGASPAELLGALSRLGLRTYSAVDQTLSPIGGQAFQPETTLDYLAVTGADPPALPDGWQFGQRRSMSDMRRALVTELRHEVPQHRAWALTVARTAPAWARLAPAVRRATRALETDEDPHVVAARSA